MPASKEEIAERLEKVETWMRTGKSTRSIVRYCDEQFGVGGRAARGYMSRVRANWKACASKVEAEERYHERVAQMEHVLDLAIAKGDLKTAITCIDRLCRVEGIIDGLKVNLNVTNVTNNVQVNHFTTSERKQRIQTLLKKRADLLDGRKAPPFDKTNGKGNGAGNGKAA